LSILTVQLCELLCANWARYFDFWSYYRLPMSAWIQNL